MSASHSAPRQTALSAAGGATIPACSPGQTALEAARGHGGTCDGGCDAPVTQKAECVTAVVAQHPASMPGKAALWADRRADPGGVAAVSCAQKPQIFDLTLADDDPSGVYGEDDVLADVVRPVCGLVGLGKTLLSSDGPGQTPLSGAQAVSGNCGESFDLEFDEVHAVYCASRGSLDSLTDPAALDAWLDGFQRLLAQRRVPL